MTRLAGAAALLAGLCLIPVSGAEPALDAALRAAAVSWDRGDYVAALTSYQAMLAGRDAARALEPIALQTGELYRTTELTADGTDPQISADGRYATYETGTGLSRVTRLVSLAGRGDTATAVQQVAELRGYGATFSLDGTRLAYLKVAPSPALTAAYAEVERIPQSERAFRLAALNTGASIEATITLRELATGRETELKTGQIGKTALVFAANNVVLFAGVPQGQGSQAQIYAVAEGRAAAPLTTGPGDKTPLIANASGDTVIVTTRGTAAGAGRGGSGSGRGGASYGLVSVTDGRMMPLNSIDRPSFSGDGRFVSFVARDADTYKVMVAATADPSQAATARSGPERTEATALSPDGSRVAYQLMDKDDWEIYTASRDGTGDRRLTREIQHDLLPQFLGANRLLSVIGEARHRRSYLYDLATGTRTRLFHNNTVRTIAPEYTWTPTADASQLLITAERDGDTVSPQRGVYVMDLTRTVSLDQLRTRVAANLASERALQATAKRLYGPIAAEVKALVADASPVRVYSYEKALFDFDSKHITKPGNKLASAFLLDTYKSFGYDAAFQWFDQRAALDGRTANVIATLKGTVNPELVYVVSSHYDSVAIGPGADDDSSGTAALLETARLLAGHPQPATIIFASFTGEEAGLLGSREFVRRAVADKLQVVGALNNDMVGWANDYRLDNTIRYSNPGIRDVQHSAAMLFSNLITYDALYYKSTDAAAYYEAYGDIVGGIGSYPVLGNPHYHQSHDLLETINHRLITEVAKTTAATLMLLASSPSRLAGLTLDSYQNGSATLSWRPALEKGVTGYLVAYGPPDKPEAQQLKSAKAAITLTNVRPGTAVRVKAINGKGLEGWDWARTTVK